MSQFDKLLQRIRSIDKNVRFDELKKVLEHCGYTMSGLAGLAATRHSAKPDAIPLPSPSTILSKRHMSRWSEMLQRQRKTMNNTIDYYLRLPYRLELIPDSEEGGFTAWYPDLPGCMTCAETAEGAVANALDAKRTWIEAALEDGLEVPVPSDEPDLTEFSGQFKLRMPKSLHRSLSVNAKKEGISMNQYCIYLLSKNDAAHQAATLHPVYA